MASTTRDWRDVARLARQRYDRMKRSNGDSSDSNNRGSAESAGEPTKPAMPKRTSMTFERSSPAVPTAGKDTFINRRASWAAPSRSEASIGKEPPPPPPPRKMQKVQPADVDEEKPKEPAAAAEPAAVDPTKVEAPLKEDLENEQENLSSARVRTPLRKSVASSKGSGTTPLQARSINIGRPMDVPPMSANKKSSEEDLTSKLVAKPFAALLKENKLSYYEMLEIADTASEKEVLRAFRNWARCVHPDHNKALTATEDFQALQHVYEVLKAPKSRLAYNCRQKLRRCAFGNRARAQAFV